MTKDGKKVIAIICECNPITKGHKMIINAAKEKFGADYIVLIMSGNYVQRGEPACISIEKRKDELLKNGADLIIKLPVEYSLSSAKYYAYANINILNKLGFIDNILFGSNINNIKILNEYAKIDINSANKKSIKTPSLYEEIYKNKLSPNDILGVEYIRAIKETKSKIMPICIKRDGKLESATSIRNKMKKKDNALNNYSDILKKIIFDAKCGLIDLNTFYNISKDFNNQILNLDDNFIKNNNFENIAKKLATKDKTLANVKRNLLHIVLGIKEDILKKGKYGKKINYIDILGFGNKGKELLKYIKTPFITAHTPLSYKAVVKNFTKQNIIDKKTLMPNNKSLISNIYSDKLYDFLKN